MKDNDLVEKGFPRETVLGRLWRRLKQSVRYWHQRRSRGFDDSVTWALDHEIADWVVPRLKRYLEIADEHFEMDNEMRNDIETVLKGFENYDENYPWKSERTIKAWESLGRIAHHLWW